MAHELFLVFSVARLVPKSQSPLRQEYKSTAWLVDSWREHSHRAFGMAWLGRLDVMTWDR